MNDELETQYTQFIRFDKTLDYLYSIKRSLNSINNRGLVWNLKNIYQSQEDLKFFSINHDPSGNIKICYESTNDHNIDVDDPFKKAMEDIEEIDRKAVTEKDTVLKINKFKPLGRLGGK